MRANRVWVRRSMFDRRWYWDSPCFHPITPSSGFAPTRPEALAAALRHLDTHHPKEDQ